MVFRAHPDHGTESPDTKAQKAEKFKKGGNNQIEIADEEYYHITLYDSICLSGRASEKIKYLCYAMAKVKVHSLSSKERQRIIGDFFCLVLRLKTKDEVLHFFMGLLTPSEAVMLARRIQIATFLIDEKNTQEMIRRKLGVSFQTIQKVDQWLHSDDLKRDAWVKGEIEGLVHKGGQQEMRMLTSRRGLNKYPGHRLWVELFSRLVQ